MTSPEQTIEQELAALGYGHRRLPNSHNTGAHEIYRLSDGAVVGSAGALEALELARGNLKVWP